MDLTPVTVSGSREEVLCSQEALFLEFEYADTESKSQAVISTEMITYKRSYKWLPQLYNIWVNRWITTEEKTCTLERETTLQSKLIKL